MNTFIDPMEWFDAGTASTTPEAKDSATKESLVEPMVFDVKQTPDTPKAKEDVARPLIDPMVWFDIPSSASTPVSDSTTAKRTTEDINELLVRDALDGKSPYDIAQEFLKGVHIRIVGEISYCYDGKIYRKISKEELKRLIVERCRKTNY